MHHCTVEKSNCKQTEDEILSNRFKSISSVQWKEKHEVHNHINLFEETEMYMLTS